MSDKNNDKEDDDSRTDIITDKWEFVEKFEFTMHFHLSDATTIEEFKRELSNRIQNSEEKEAYKNKVVNEIERLEEKHNLDDVLIQD